MADERQEVWRAFWAGATTPSAMAVVGAVATAGVVLAVAFTALTQERFVSAFGEYWTENGWDDYAFLSRDVMRAAGAPWQRPGVAVLGASGIREALSDSRHLRAEIVRYSQQEVDVFDWTGSDLHIPEMGAIIERVPAGFDGVIVFGVGMRTLAYGPRLLQTLARQPRLAFVSSWLDDEIRGAGIDLPWRSGNYLWDNRQFYIARLPAFASNLWRSAPRRSYDQYRFDAPVDAVGRAALIGELDLQFPTAADRVAANLERFAQLIRRTERGGRIRVAIVEAPINPEFIVEWGAEDRFAQHRQRMAQFAEQIGVPYWNVIDAAGIGADDFFDATHLRTEDAQHRFTTALASRVAPLLGRSGS